MLSQQEALVILAPPVFQAAGESETDSAAVRLPTPADSTRRRLRCEIDAGYHQPPVHPYFRDEYRLLQDVRRLVDFVAPYRVRGMESLAELKAIAEAMPVAKQTAIIRVAVGGSLANYVSEIVSRHLRRQNLGFVQWQLEKVSLRRQLGRFQVNGYGGLHARGMSVTLPAWRLHYSHHVTAYYRYDSFNYWPRPFLGFNYMRLDQRSLLGPRLALAGSLFALSYDCDLPTLITAFALRRSNRLIIRLEYIDYFTIKNADYFKSEVLLHW